MDLEEFEFNQKLQRQNYTNRGTIRHNKFDIEYINKTPIYIDENGVEHSLNKNGNWELFNNPDIKQIKYHRHVQGASDGNSLRYKYKKARKYVTVNGQRQNDQYKINNEKEYIELPFDKNEYPINREPHQCYGTGCECCFRSDGRIWQLKGDGDKAKKKNKGMKREKLRDNNYNKYY